MSAQNRVSVRIDTTEADAVLRILDKRESGTKIDESDWSTLFATEGYIRLKKRELGLTRPFTEESFREFVMSGELLARREKLGETLARWKQASPDAAADRALAYLPANATIKATIYPVIKPRDNSFVFEIKTDPAIFLFLDPAVTPEQFENTLAHELHHIGFGTACPPTGSKARMERLSSGPQKILRWVGAFGEGLAMLAAAGGTDTHPHAVSKLADRERWDRDVANFNNDLKKVESFFLDLAAGKLTEDEETKTAFSFFGVQGPWYTVGWKMAFVIEKTYGRQKLIDCFCSAETLLATYNRAARQYERRSGEKLAVWSSDLLRRLK
ncbi:MAG TPA: DUF5700 domain-containing putative Zn-dependent protease [Pyrinomonadaceae bacterium]